MIRNFLFAAAIYAITLGGLVWYNCEPDQLTESERLAARHEMKDEYKAAIRDQLERFRTGRLTEEEKAEVAAAQEKFLRVFDNSMKDLSAQIDQMVEETSDKDEDLMAGRKAVDECLRLWEDDKAYLECLEGFYQ